LLLQQQQNNEHGQQKLTVLGKVSVMYQFSAQWTASGSELLASDNVLRPIVAISAKYHRFAFDMCVYFYTVTDAS